MTETEKLENLALMMRRLIRLVPAHSQTRKAAIELLKRYGLEGSPLR